MALIWPQRLFKNLVGASNSKSTQMVFLYKGGEGGMDGWMDGKREGGVKDGRREGQR